jgi:hypothetical protein
MKTEWTATRGPAAEVTQATVRGDGYPVTAAEMRGSNTTTAVLPERIAAQPS